MTLQELITKYAGTVHRSTALELKRNPKFMEACRNCPEFKEWVLLKKPTMATVRLPDVKFKTATPPPFKLSPDGDSGDGPGPRNPGKDLSSVPSVAEYNPVDDKASGTTTGGHDSLSCPQTNNATSLFRDVEKYRENNPDKFGNLT